VAAFERDLPSTAVGIALYHISLWQGKALWYQGEFSLLACLQRALIEVQLLRYRPTRVQVARETE
jgi:hypothetical protein